MTCNVWLNIRQHCQNFKEEGWCHIWRTHIQDFSTTKMAAIKIQELQFTLSTNTVFCHFFWMNFLWSPNTETLKYMILSTVLGHIYSFSNLWHFFPDKSPKTDSQTCLKISNFTRFFQVSLLYEMSDKYIKIFCWTKMLFRSTGLQIISWILKLDVLLQL